MHLLSDDKSTTFVITFSLNNETNKKKPLLVWKRPIQNLCFFVLLWKLTSNSSFVQTNRDLTVLWEFVMKWQERVEIAYNLVQLIRVEVLWCPKKTQLLKKVFCSSQSLFYCVATNVKPQENRGTWLDQEPGLVLPYDSRRFNPLGLQTTAEFLSSSSINR